MADYNFVVSTGVVVPDTATTLAEVQAEFQGAFGTGLSLAPETPQGVLMAMEADARDGVLRLCAALANQINPNLAQGIFLDAIWALTGGQRRVATRSVLEGVVLTGQPGTLIPEGAVASVASTSAQFRLTGNATLDAAGTTTATFQSVEFGPVDAPPGTLTQVGTQVLGWEGVTNPTAATPGQLVESDAASRQRRRDTLALQSVGLVQSIRSGLMDTADVRSCIVRENYTDAPLEVDGVTLAPHSVYAVVDGGTDADVAATLLDRKSLGAGWNGDTVVDVVEPASGQTYEVKFDRPDLLPIFVRVEIRGGSTLADPENAVRDAIVDYANGALEDEPGLTVGQDVSSFELAGAVNRQHPSIYVRSLTIGTSPGALSPAAVTVEIWERAQISAGNIVVEVVG